MATDPLERNQLAAELLKTMVAGMWNIIPALATQGSPDFMIAKAVESACRELPGRALWMADALNACIQQNPVSLVGDTKEPDIVA